MQLISDHMIKHHRECDAVLGRVKEAAMSSDWAVLQKEAGTFLHEIERHIEFEETLLFPAFEQTTGMREEPTATMRLDHKQLRGMFAQMRAALEARDAKRCLDASMTLMILLQEHNLKEESMMYPMLDRALGDDTRGLLTQLESSTP